MSAATAAAIARAYEEACRAELSALKPGNVHVFADGHRMTVADFERSAAASAAPIARTGARVGERVRAAVEATAAAVGQNTNLGIVLLAAPLAVAAECGGDVRARLAEVLRDLDVRDAADVFAAIRRASPAGLGQAPEHDVAAPPRIDLRSAMAAAAERDRIARAYVTDFEDVFAIGLPALREATEHGLPEPWRITAVFLAFLAAVPDTHIARKFGPAQAKAIRDQARRLTAGLELGPGAAARLLAFDADLKHRGLNPGTSADFTVATLFAAALCNLSSPDVNALLAGEGRSS